WPRRRVVRAARSSEPRFSQRGPTTGRLGSRRLPLPPAQNERALLLRALRAADERAFAALVDMYGPSLLRLAQLYVSSRAVAEEGVQGKRVVRGTGNTRAWG